jgi:hypothetical protein
LFGGSKSSTNPNGSWLDSIVRSSANGALIEISNETSGSNAFRRASCHSITISLPGAGQDWLGVAVPETTSQDRIWKASDG